MTMRRRIWACLVAGSAIAQLACDDTPPSEPVTATEINASAVSSAPHSAGHVHGVSRELFQRLTETSPIIVIEGHNDLLSVARPEHVKSIQRLFPAEAVKRFGESGKYGAFVVRLTDEAVRELQGGETGK